MDNLTPHVGIPMPHPPDGQCTYHYDKANTIRCTNPATTHVLSVAANDLGEYYDGEDQVVGMATCNYHLPIARAAGYVLAEHPHTYPCGELSRLDTRNNRCVLDMSQVDNPQRERENGDI